MSHIVSSDDGFDLKLFVCSRTWIVRFSENLSAPLLTDPVPEPSVSTSSWSQTRAQVYRESATQLSLGVAFDGPGRTVCAIAIPSLRTLFMTYARREIYGMPSDFRRSMLDTFSLVDGSLLSLEYCRYQRTARILTPSTVETLSWGNFEVSLGSGCVHEGDQASSQEHERHRNTLGSHLGNRVSNYQENSGLLSDTHISTNILPLEHRSTITCQVIISLSIPRQTPFREGKHRVLHIYNSNSLI